MNQTVSTTFEALAEVIGKDAALNLCDHYGGETLYIRKTAESDTTKNHWQTFYGKDAQERLHRHFGGQRCYIPKAPPELLEARNGEIVARLKNGERRDAVAKAFRLTLRSVAQIFQNHLTHKGA